jgi:hypothetical protein
VVPGKRSHGAGVGLSRTPHQEGGCRLVWSASSPCPAPTPPRFMLHDGVRMNFLIEVEKLPDCYLGKLVRVLVKSFVKAHLVVKIKSFSSTS